MHQLSYKSSEFKFGNFSIVNDNLSTREGLWDLHLRNGSDWNLKNLTELSLGNWNFKLEFHS